MEDSLDVVKTDDSLNIAAKDWNRTIEIAKKHGYREGVASGADSVFQEGFDIGYKEAFQTAFILGKFKSILNFNPQDVKLPDHIKEILDKTRRGACYICMEESEGRNDMQKSLSQIINEQRTYSLNIIQTLYEYFQPYVKELNINELDVLKMHNQVQEPSEDE
ncbi:uncharacterized protein LOC117602677 [Osmia lignaria lignaria]|uniref:uncharacterized protein LOC117602677 n=1 Tax=Osmia lignaria lignaria TaxID=1437193 RepID=UPI00147879AA|nr:uncharacterized protein LOC117602677 [Osmia lignaria]